ncbi:MAG TPA: carboxymuconolactone decarboxylase family protein [Bacteroidota bacterium]
MTQREKTSVTLAALYALNKRNDALRVLERNGHSPHHLVELFFHLSLLLGFPSMLDGMEKLAILGLLPRNSSRGTRTKAYRQRGLKTLRRVYGAQTDKLLKSLKSIQPGLPAIIVEDVYGKVIARSGMTLRERELVNVTVLTIQGLNRQLHSHVRGALRVGVTPASLRDVLRFLARRYRVNVSAARELLSQLS